MSEIIHTTMWFHNWNREKWIKHTSRPHKTSSEIKSQMSKLGFQSLRGEHRRPRLSSPRAAWSPGLQLGVCESAFPPDCSLWGEGCTCVLASAQHCPTLQLGTGQGTCGDTLPRVVSTQAPSHGLSPIQHISQPGNPESLIKGHFRPPACLAINICSQQPSPGPSRVAPM